MGLFGNKGEPATKDTGFAFTTEDAIAEGLLDKNAAQETSRPETKKGWLAKLASKFGNGRDGNSSSDPTKSEFPAEIDLPIGATLGQYFTQEQFLKALPFIDRSNGHLNAFPFASDVATAGTPDHAKLLDLAQRYNKDIDAQYFNWRKSTLQDRNEKFNNKM